MDVLLPDDTKLKHIIRLLCTTKVRAPLGMEKIKTWLKQFVGPEEQRLALLIVRNLIYRTSGQIESSLRQALKEAALHFSPPTLESMDRYSWRDVLSNKQPGRTFYFGPPVHEYTPPGKSGELIIRLLQHSFNIGRSYLRYPTDSILDDDDYYIMVDDGAFSGHQLEDIIRAHGSLMRGHERAGIVLSIAHESAIHHLNQNFPEIKIFCGELLTNKDNFEEVSKGWVEKKLWPYADIDPITLYRDIAYKRAGFVESESLGWGGLGLLVAYEHGVPDNSLQLLWQRSDNWNPLFER
ncbi:phosphoribosyltransferase-like protein [Pseudomonas capeferrum]